DEQGIDHGKGAAIAVKYGPAPGADVVGRPEGLVVGQDVVREDHGAAEVLHGTPALHLIGVPALHLGQAVGDGQVVDGDVGAAAADVKGARGVVAADGQPVGPRPVDGQVVADLQLARQRDGAVQPGGEVDRVGAGVGVGGGDRRRQRAGAAVVEVQ